MLVLGLGFYPDLMIDIASVNEKLHSVLKRDARWYENSIAGIPMDDKCG